jgi:hypothetical protein
MNKKNNKQEDLYEISFGRVGNELYRTLYFNEYAKAKESFEDCYNRRWVGNDAATLSTAKWKDGQLMGDQIIAYFSTDSPIIVNHPSEYDQSQD